MTATENPGPGPQKALVTGATSGLGRAIARRLARDGLEVVVHGRDPERGAETVEQIERAGGAARFTAADLNDPADIEHLAAEASDVDVLVNNAGFSVFGPTADLKADTFDALFASNVRAPYFLVAALAPGMAARGSGSIINISSMVGRVGGASSAAYGATKGALESLTRAWAAEFSPSGVRVNAVAPGPLYTPGAPEERITTLGTTTPMGRAASPEEITGLVSLLASAQASYITGAVLAADGGRTAV
jgi:NAD(P)-dependent dehydrogenase (short-subunit alcohol dehydrogenase family)